MKRLQRGFLFLLCMLLVGCAPSMPEGAPGPEDQTVISPSEQETPSSDPLVLLIDIPNRSIGICRRLQSAHRWKSNSQKEPTRHMSKC